MINCSSLLIYAHPCSHGLNYAHIRLSMLVYGHLCSSTTATSQDLWWFINYIHSMQLNACLSTAEHSFSQDPGTGLLHRWAGAIHPGAGTDALSLPSYANTSFHTGCCCCFRQRFLCLLGHRRQWLPSAEPVPELSEQPSRSCSTSRRDAVWLVTMTYDDVMMTML